MQKIEDQVAYFTKDILDIDSNIFIKEDLEAAFRTSLSLITNYKIKEYQDFGEYKLPRYPDGSLHLTRVPVHFFVNMVNANVDTDWLIDVEVWCGCLYRKNWDAVATDYEMVEAALKFKKAPAIYAVQAISLFNELVSTLRHRYPLLYQNEEESSKSDDRQLMGMINGLAQNDVTKWDKVRQLWLEDAFMYLEELKVEYLKKKNKDHPV